MNLSDGQKQITAHDLLDITSKCNFSGFETLSSALLLDQ